MMGFGVIESYSGESRGVQLHWCYSEEDAEDSPLYVVKDECHARISSSKWKELVDQGFAYIKLIDMDFGQIFYIGEI